MHQLYSHIKCSIYQKHFLLKSLTKVSATVLLSFDFTGLQKIVRLQFSIILENVIGSGPVPHGYCITVRRGNATDFLLNIWRSKGNRKTGSSGVGIAIPHASLIYAPAESGVTKTFPLTISVSVIYFLALVLRTSVLIILIHEENQLPIAVFRFI